MKIENHILTDTKYIESPNHSKEFKENDLRFLVMHYTGGTTLEGAVNTFSNNSTKVSAHLIIDRDGKTIQMVPFNVIAWHAGKSEWKGLKWLNKYSIGIEFVNTGKLEKKNGLYKDYWGHVINEEDVYYNMRYFWQNFTDIQIEKGLEISKLLIKEYKLIDIMGHNDISPERKIDPGGAFPMMKFKNLLK